MYRIVFLASAVTILTTVGYGLATSILYASGSIPDIGQSLVDVNFPLHHFAQPVTYLSIASVTFFYTGLRLWQNKVARWTHLRLASLQLLAIVVAFVSAYEVLYNFVLLGSYFSVQILSNNMASPNLISNLAPTPWNLDFATKIFASLFVIGGYSAYFLRKVHQVRGLPDAL